MPLSIQVVWGGRWNPGERLTPEGINRIFEQASFLLQGTLDAATIPPGSLTAEMIGVTFVSGLAQATPEGPDFLFGHDTSVGAPRKFLISEVLNLGFGSAASVTSLAEGDEFAVMVGGIAKKIALPLVRKELIDTPNVLTWATTQITVDRVLVFDGSANEAKSATPAELVRSVTDRVVTTAGSATAFTLASGCSITPLATGIRVIAKFHAASGTAATLNVDSLGAKALMTSDGAAMSAGRIVVGQIVELIYDAAANSGAGAWMALGIMASSSRTSVVFNGAIGVQNIGLDGTADAANDWITNVGHGLLAGEVVWYDTSAGLPAVNTPYYVIVVDVNRYRLATSKALAAAGTYIQLTAQDLTARHWVTDPILASTNVDGVIWMDTGRYYIDFTTPLSTANYTISLAVELEQGNAAAPSDICVDRTYRTRTTDGFGIHTYNQNPDAVSADWISVLVLP